MKLLLLFALLSCASEFNYKTYDKGFYAGCISIIVDFGMNEDIDNFVYERYLKKCERDYFNLTRYHLINW